MSHHEVGVTTGLGGIKDVHRLSLDHGSGLKGLQLIVSGRSRGHDLGRDVHVSHLSSNGSGIGELLLGFKKSLNFLESVVHLGLRLFGGLQLLLCLLDNGLFFLVRLRF